MLCIEQRVLMKCKLILWWECDFALCYNAIENILFTFYFYAFSMCIHFAEICFIRMEPLLFSLRKNYLIFKNPITAATFIP